MEFHEFSQLFPLSPAQDADVLTRSIKKHGLKHTIWTFERKILDGRNRYIACKKAGVQPRFVEFKGTREQALDFVAIQNLELRHLTHGQRTEIAVRLEVLYSQEARDSYDPRPKPPADFQVFPVTAVPSSTTAPRDRV